MFNIAQSADVFVNATCGGRDSEVYCKHDSSGAVGFGRSPECGVCDASDPAKAHPIEHAVDGGESWWQSPSLQNGPEFNYVTITVDLKKVHMYYNPCDQLNNSVLFATCETCGRCIIYAR